MKKSIVGIDISMDSFVSASSKASSKSLEVQEHDYRTQEDVANFIALYRGQEVHFVMEFTSSYHKRLAFALCAEGFDVSLVPPKKSYHFAQMHRAGTKTDKEDAKLMHKLGTQEELPLYIAPNEEKEQRKQKNALLNKLRQMLVAVKNRLHAWKYEPYGDNMVKKILDQQKEMLEKQIEEVEEDLALNRQETDEQDIKNLTSIAGIGEKTAEAIIACAKSMPDFATHKNSKKMAKFVGLAPCVSQSGKTDRRVGRAAAGQQALRSSLYQGVLSAVTRTKKDNPLKTFYHSLREKGKCFKKALVATMHKALRIAFAVLQTKQPFDLEYQKATAVP